MALLASQPPSHSPDRLPAPVTEARTDAQSHRFPWLLLLIMLAGFCLRIYQLARWNIWGDEWFSIREATATLEWMVGTAGSLDPHPLLYYLTLAGWVRVAGLSETAIRFLSVLAGVLLIPAIYKLGRTLFNPSTALIAAFLTAFNPYLILNDRNARMYSQLLLLAVLSTYFLVREMRSESRKPWLWYSLASLAGLYTHYSYPLVVIAQASLVVFECLFVLPRHTRLVILKRWLIAASIAGLAFLPWAIYVAPFMLHHNAFYPEAGYVPPWEVIHRLLVTYSLGQMAELSIIADLIVNQLFAAIWAGLFLLGIAGLRQTQHRHSMRIILLLIVTPLIITSLLYLLKPFFDERYLITLLPFFLLGVAHGADSLRHLPVRVLGTVLLAAGLLAMLAVNLTVVQAFYFDDRYKRPDYRQLVQMIESRRGPDDILIFTNRGNYNIATYYIQLYYTHGAGTSLIFDVPSSEITGPFGPQIYILDQLDSIPTVLSRILAAQPGQIWFVPYWDQPEDKATTAGLVAQSYLVNDGWLDKIHLLTFLAPSGQAKLQPAERRYGDGLQFHGYLLEAGAEVQPGQALRLAFDWSTEKQIEHDYNVSLRLLDEQGHVILQNDRQPQAGFKPTTSWKPGEEILDRYGLQIPIGTLPGTYRLEMGIYDPVTGAQLTPISGDGKPQSPEITTITISPPQDAPPTAQDLDRLIAGLHMQAEPGPAANGIRLLASAFTPGPSMAGKTISLALLWQAERRPDNDPVVTLSLGDAGSWSIPLTRIHPPSTWRAGDVFIEYYDLPVPPTTRSGPVSLQVRLNQSSTSLGTIEIQARDHHMVAPPVQYRANTQFGTLAMLAGYDLTPSPATAGESIDILLHWQASTTAARDAISYKIFVHLLDAGGKVVAQHDGEPGNGAMATTGWLAGEYIDDHHTINLPAGLAPGKYQLEIGFYDPETGKRIPLLDDRSQLQGDSLILDRPVVIEH